MKKCYNDVYPKKREQKKNKKMKNILFFALDFKDFQGIIYQNKKGVQKHLKTKSFLKGVIRMKEIVKLMINGYDIYYFNLQKENFMKNFRCQNFEEALESLEQQKFDLENQLLKINEAIEIMNR